MFASFHRVERPSISAGNLFRCRDHSGGSCSPRVCCSLFFAPAENPGGTDLVVVTKSVRPRRRTMYPAGQKALIQNECAAAHCPERPRRDRWARHHPRPCWRASEMRKSWLVCAIQVVRPAKRRSDKVCRGTGKRVFCSNGSNPWTPTIFTSSKWQNATSKRASAALYGGTAAQSLVRSQS